MEGNFCGSANVENGNKNTAGIEEHGVNTDFSADFGSSDWTTMPE